MFLSKREINDILSMKREELSKLQKSIKSYEDLLKDYDDISAFKKAQSKGP